MSSRKSTKHRRRERRWIFEDFERNRAQRMIRRETSVFLGSSRPVEMSQVLFDFLDPYMDGTESESELRTLITIGQLAWNLALIPANEREGEIRELIHAGAPDAAEEFRSIVHQLIERKLQRFSGIDRFILHYDLMMTDDGPHVRVLSAFAL